MLEAYAPTPHVLRFWSAFEPGIVPLAEYDVALGARVCEAFAEAVLSAGRAGNGLFPYVETKRRQGLLRCVADSVEGA
jgi:hypothetical protein